MTLDLGKEKTILGDFSASGYIDAAITNTTAPHPICIGKADEVVRFFFDGWLKSDHVSSLKMFSLAWGSLRSATLVTRMGMTIQAYPIQRQALEAIVYGILFRFDKDFHDLWKSRHTDHRASSEFRRKHWSRALEIIEEKDPKLKDGITKLYQTSIDFGAHPNPLSLDMMSEYDLVEGAKDGTATYSMLLGQPFVDISHVHTASIYNVLIDAILLTWPERASEIDLVPLAKSARICSVDFINQLQEPAEKQSQ